jgi:hypothetical protein
MIGSEDVPEARHLSNPTLRRGRAALLLSGRKSNWWVLFFARKKKLRFLNQRDLVFYHRFRWFKNIFDYLCEKKG